MNSIAEFSNNLDLDGWWLAWSELEFNKYASNAAALELFNSANVDLPGIRYYEGGCYYYYVVAMDY